MAATACSSVSRCCSKSGWCVSALSAVAVMASSRRRQSDRGPRVARCRQMIAGIAAMPQCAMASNLGSRVAFTTPLETRHVRIWLAVVLVSIAIGTAGYMLIAGWSLSDALYMTVSTLATVGFGEVRPLDEVGRAWTILLMVTGVGIIFGTIGIVAEAVVGE